MRVLLVEDSRSVRVYVEGILLRAPDIELLPPAMDGITAVDLAVRERPDVILMDLELPRLDGIKAIQEIMALSPRPIVVLSGTLSSSPERDRTFDALNAGAVDVMRKPSGLDDASIDTFATRLLKTLRLMSQARVLRRRSARPALGSEADLRAARRQQLDIVLLGGSTGAPVILYNLLQRLAAPFPVPIAVAQHIIPGFEQGLAEWLSRTGHKARVIEEGERPTPGVVHVAPADRHVAIRPAGFQLVEGAAGTPIPSADILFRSAAECFGERVVGVLLSGMGEDGARGLLALRERGSFTLTQSADTCVVAGMPSSARALGASCLDASPAQMVEMLTRLAGAPPRT